MNKTHKRAIEKHRAAAAKFAIRRKTEGGSEQSSSAPSPAPSTAAKAKIPASAQSQRPSASPKPAPKRREGTEPSAGE